MSNAITLEQVFDAILDLTQATGNMDVRLTGELKGVNGRLGGVETRLGGVETRLGGVETRLGNLENRVEGLEGDVRTLGGSVDRLGVRLVAVEGGLAELTTVVRSVDRRLAAVETR